MPDRELLVRIVGDDRSLQQAFNRSSRSAQQFETRSQAIGRNLTRAFAAAGISLGAAAGVAAVRESIEAASDLNEQISRTQVILGDAADETIKWSTTTARSMGISQRAALSAAATFAGLFQTVGVQQTQAGELSRSLVQLAADLASLQNSSPEEALVALRSGLAGEAEPLRRFNIFLTEARVQQEALTESGKTAASQLTAQEKTLARYNLILQDAAPAMGNFADTSKGLANQQRILAAEVDDLSTKLGSVLLPAMTGIVGAAIDAADAVGKLFDALEAIANLPVIEVAFKFTFGGGRGAEIFRDILLGQVSPLALAAKLAGKAGAFGGATLDVPTITPDDPTDPRRDTRRTGAARARAAAAEAEAAAVAEAKEAANRLARTRKRFAEFTKGLGLKLKTAGLTDSLDDDIRVLHEIEAAILREIAVEGRTFALASDLADIRLQIASANEQKANQIAAAEQDAADAQEAADERRRQQLERQRNARKASQFLALGLTAEGDQRVPGIGALRRRARALLEQISDTPLDTSRNRDRIGAVLSKQFKDAGREVRQAILDMFNDISRALGDGSKTSQNAAKTAFRVVNTSDILSGLGLSEEETQRLRRRLSRLGPGGTTPQSTTTGGAFGFGFDNNGVVINGNVIVQADSVDDFQRQLERRGRRTAGSRTGNFGGRKN